LDRTKKEKVVEELGVKLRQVNCMFLTEYSGMNVTQMTRLRNELRNVNGELSVVKNTLLKIASTGTKAEVLKDQFTGPNAIICVYNDPVSAARVISSFAKEVPQLKVKAGFLGAQVMTPEGIFQLATLPPRDVLLGKCLGVLKGIPQRFVYVLSANLMKLMMTLQAVKQKKEQMEGGN